MKKGFTLAEVLITLTIIGVIAALTIPNLMQSYKKHQVEAGVKEAYSILANSLKMAQAEGDGGISDMVETAFSLNEDIYDAHTYFAEKYMLPYLKYTKTCKPNVPQSDCGIFTDTRLKNPDGTNDGGSHFDTTLRYRILLQNGMFLSVGMPQTTRNDAICFHFDINGAKGSNKIGEDIFFFIIEGMACEHPNSYYCPRKDYISGGWGGTSKYSQDATNGCTFHEAYNCARDIMKNSWKIPDDYPVKKW